MKLKVKHFFVFGFFLFLFCIAAYFLSQWFVMTEWKRSIGEDRVKELAKLINDGPPIPSNFNTLLETYYLGCREKDMNGKFYSLMVKTLTGINSKKHHGEQFFMEKTANLLLDGSRLNTNSFLDHGLILAYGLGNYTSASKCVDYYMWNKPLVCYDSIQSKPIKLIGIEEISQHYFSKTIEKLNRNQLIELIVYMEPVSHVYRKEASLERFNKRKKLINAIIRMNATKK
jgi:hypothetical protein